jgi:hypothetical protein
VALVDIDRHILSQITQLQIEVRNHAKAYEKEWGKVIEVRDKTDSTLFNSNVDCTVKTEACLNREKYLKKLRNQIFAATKKCSSHAAGISSAVSKQEALMMHLVSLVEKVDTGKGMETTKREVQDGNN